MVRPYNLLCPTQPVAIVSYPYLNLYHNPHNVSYRLNLQQKKYYTLLYTPILYHNAVEISDRPRFSYMEIPPLLSSELDRKS